MMGCLVLSGLVEANETHAIQRYRVYAQSEDLLKKRSAQSSEQTFLLRVLMNCPTQRIDVCTTDRNNN